MIATKLMLMGAAVASLAFAAAAEPLAPTDATLPVQWEISPDDEADSVQLSLRYRRDRSESHNSQSFPLGQLEGLDRAQLSSSNQGPVHFRMTREAGILDCEGSAADGRGRGDCLFRANAGFADSLERRGLGRPSLDNQYMLALQDVGTPLVEELERQGYDGTDVDDLVALGIHGADLDYLRALGSLGYRADDADGLVAMRIHGVTPDFIRQMGELGYRNFDADELVAMRIHGVDPELVRTLASLGYSRLSAEEITAMAIHGVTPQFIREMAEVGYRNLTADQLVQLRIHGVTAEDARQANAALAQSE